MQATGGFDYQRMEKRLKQKVSCQRGEEEIVQSNKKRNEVTGDTREQESR